jgi:hypothetical protein
MYNALKSCLAISRVKTALKIDDSITCFDSMIRIDVDVMDNRSSKCWFYLNFEVYDCPGSGGGEALIIYLS